MALNEQQQAAFHLMATDLHLHQKAFLHAGQRSGANAIVKAYIDANKEAFAQISVMSINHLTATDFCQSWNVYGPKVLLNRMPDLSIAKPTLVIIHEALWQHLGWAIYLMAVDYGYHVLTVSTNGPERKDGYEFMNLISRRSYKTTDLDPEFDVEAHRSVFGNDTARFERDYLNY